MKHVRERRRHAQHICVMAVEGAMMSGTGTKYYILLTIKHNAAFPQNSSII